MALSSILFFPISLFFILFFYFGTWQLSASLAIQNYERNFFFLLLFESLRPNGPKKTTKKKFFSFEDLKHGITSSLSWCEREKNWNKNNPTPPIFFFFSYRVKNEEAQKIIFILWIFVIVFVFFFYFFQGWTRKMESVGLSICTK
jgi:hypothetical protein